VRRAERVGIAAPDRQNLIRVMPAQGALGLPSASAARVSGRSELEHDALVFAGGEPLHEQWHPHLPAAELVVAADSGLEHASAAGRPADVIVGDLDSVDPVALAAAIEAGITVERHAVDKDQTDLELALDAVWTRGARRVLVLGAGGGRLDHFLANALLLASPTLADLEIEAWVGPARVVVVRSRAQLHGKPGSLLSLLALGGPARGVRTAGLRFALHGEDLQPGSTRGVSNELSEPRAVVSLEHGVLLAVQPDGGIT
jgi:thiamine pyrophosphokinase